MSKAGLERDRIAGFVLAGGESRRMGRDKALVDFAGEPLISRALKILRQAGLEARIAGARVALEHFAPVIPDSELGHGPLAGVCAALAACLEPRAVIVPADLPLLPDSLVTFLVHRAAMTDAIVTLASVSGFTQTFPVVLDRTVLPGLEVALKHGHGGCYAAFEAAAAVLGQRVASVPVEYLAQAGQVTHPDGLPPAMWFLNVNAPADLARAEAVVRAVA